ncbi:MAG TPA: cytochrome c biogenesis protein ResB [Methylophilaceae bacterium]|nr:cytochrome c biogenesis protein ResB [Methylophilaceae bacterium]
MRFAVSLLTIIGIASIIGTVLKQNEPYTNYMVQFSQFWFEFFEKLGLYDVYHSIWFLVILLFLVISTSLCIYRNSPLMLRELKAYRENATEKSLRSFSHQHEYELKGSSEEAEVSIGRFLTARGFRFKRVTHQDGSRLIAAKAGSYQRLGYIFTHAAIVVICIGGLLDGNVPLKVQEMLGQKKIETLDIPPSEVPDESRLSTSNLSFRGNMSLPEGGQANVAFLRVRDGYLVQELPFTVELKDFRIEHYATGQPKSFESDLVIIDKQLNKTFEHTIKVNHPLTYKGITIYQSDFQDGGSGLVFNAWNLLGAEAKPSPLNGTIFESTSVGEGQDALKIEFNDFRLFNILNLSPDGKGKPRNVGPSVTFKVRDAAGQAREYTNYMQPLRLDGRAYFVSGMRATPQEDFKYLRIPADADFGIDGFMQLRAVMFDKGAYSDIAHNLTVQALASASDKEIRANFERSVIRLLELFSKGGYTAIATEIEQTIPEAEREKAAQTYIKILHAAAFEAYKLSLKKAGKQLVADESSEIFMQDSLNAISDLFFYEAPFYLQLASFEHREASGLQLTRSPGKNLVYAGSLLLVIGIFAMIYIRERRIWMLIKPKEGKILFAMSANRKNRDFDLEFDRYSEQLPQALESGTH